MNWREGWKKFTNVGRWPLTEVEQFKDVYERDNPQLDPSFYPSKPRKEGLDIIIGYEKVKNVVRRALESEQSMNLLFIGNYATAKSLFLRAIAEECNGQCMYYDGTNTTNKILEEMDKRRPKVICIDEIEKMRKNYQNQILSLAETGRIKVTQFNRHFDFTLPGVKIFATANDLKKITGPLRSRFRPIVMTQYTEEQYIEIAQALPELERLPKDLVKFIAEEVYRRKGDIREILGIGKLVREHDTPEEVYEVIETLSQRLPEELKK